MAQMGPAPLQLRVGGREFAMVLLGLILMLNTMA